MWVGLRLERRLRLRLGLVAVVYRVKIKTIVACFHQTWHSRIDLIPPLYPRFLHGIQHSPTTPTTSVRTVFIAIDNGGAARQVLGSSIRVEGP